MMSQVDDGGGMLVDPTAGPSFTMTVAGKQIGVKQL